MTSVGTYSLAMSVLLYAAAAIASLAAVRFSSAAALRWSKRLLLLALVGISVACWALIRLLLDSDFSVAYVAGYSERALPTGYKLAAFWAGQEGSLLLWAWLLAVMSVLLSWQRHDRSEGEQATALGVMAIVSGFFAAVLVYAADPFELLPQTAADGRGLNPLLQHPSMIAHPPLLFIGYAGFTVPFAMLVAALVARRRDNQWIAATRRWLLVAWVMLSVGILLGAQWAYVELGWGGYWAWDPVENASLLPWLTSTALLHSLLVQQQRGMFKRWNAWLITASFLLCIFATYLTRSGVIQSVHAFGESLIGTLFLGFMVVVGLASVGLLVLRHRDLAGDRELVELVSKDGFILAANALLVIMTVVTAIGTIFPLISGLFVNEPISVGPPFYNKVIVPMGLALAALMSVGPLLAYGKLAAQSLVRGLIVPGIFVAIVVIALVSKGITEPWALACASVCTVAVSVMTMQLLRSAAAHAQQTGSTLGGAIVSLIDGNHRRYGGQFVHLGVVMMIVGICGSSLFGTSANLKLSPGHSEKVGSYTVTAKALSQVRGANYAAVQGHVIVTDAAGSERVLHPQMRFYDKAEQAHSEIALETSLRRDIYVTLAGWEANGSTIALQVLINPLVSWIWIGGIVLTIGGVFCALPRLLPSPHGRAIALPVGTGACNGETFDAAKPAAATATHS